MYKNNKFRVGLKKLFCSLEIEKIFAFGYYELNKDKNLLEID